MKSGQGAPELRCQALVEEFKRGLQAGEAGAQN